MPESCCYASTSLLRVGHKPAVGNYRAVFRLSCTHGAWTSFVENFYYKLSGQLPVRYSQAALPSYSQIPNLNWCLKRPHPSHSRRQRKKSHNVF